jgi:hypothetical protein
VEQVSIFCLLEGLVSLRRKQHQFADLLGILIWVVEGRGNDRRVCSALVAVAISQLHQGGSSGFSLYQGLDLCAQVKYVLVQILSLTFMCPPCSFAASAPCHLPFTMHLILIMTEAARCSMPKRP